VTLIGVSTMLIAGIGAIIEEDMKKIIALSTLRQLGVMFFALGLGESILAFIHLIRHAYFKAIIFMCAGAIIHSVKDYQDIRKLGTWGIITPSLKIGFLIGSLRLTGMPFSSGFYSKDTLLEQFLIGETNAIVWIIGILATLLTMAYSIRIVFTLFINHSLREPFSQEADALYRIGGGGFVLILFSIIGGYPLLGIISYNPTVVMPT